MITVEGYLHDCVTKLTTGETLSREEQLVLVGIAYGLLATQQPPELRHLLETLDTIDAWGPSPRAREREQADWKEFREALRGYKLATSPHRNPR